MILAPENDPQRARATLPPGLSIEQSGIPGAGLGVWTDVRFEARTLFGPYEGVITDQRPTQGYAWQLYGGGKRPRYVDASQESCSNWLRYINCANMESRQNLVAFQYRGHIFYRSYKTILPGTELLVWYGTSFARELGIDLLEDPLSERLQAVYEAINGKKMFQCTMCQRIFANQALLASHTSRKHPSSLITKTCQLCPYSTTNVYQFRIHYKIHLKDEIFRCNTCGRTFLRQGTFEKHMYLHTGKEMHECPKCNKKFLKQQYLDMHDKKVHQKEFRFICPFCGKAFCNESLLEIHERTHTGQKPYRCEKCGIRTAHASTLRKHILKLHKLESPLRLENGSLQKKSDSTLKENERVENTRPGVVDDLFYFNSLDNEMLAFNSGHSPEPIKDDDSNSTLKPLSIPLNNCINNKNSRQNEEKTVNFNFKIENAPGIESMKDIPTLKPKTDDLNEISEEKDAQVAGKRGICPQGEMVNSSTSDLSTSSSTKEKPYSCTECSYRTAHLANLTTHRHTHTGEKPYSCTQCNYRTKQSAHLTAHRRTHTGEKPYSCTQCNYRTTNLANLIIHRRTHTGEKPYSCTQCNYRAARLSDLTKHRRTHTGEKPYSCTQCNYRTAHLQHLTRHRRTHTGKKPYSCTQCNYRAAQLSDLTKHRRTHTGEKPYSCTQCNYRTAVLSSLTRHRRTHTGEKPYSCTQCNYRTADLQHLTTHRRTHTGEKPYSCTQCNYRAAQSCSIKDHTKRHHPAAPTT
ncbi:PRDM9 [Cordylochernes scorpioides]|uniref:PRDM9 n=1 Tax=Cordylochernes scorpioides TaxID=51811 RepID=A0ABY6LJW6_9ARAC|nr:PRDM9 [Cordylochernes scorpioides]